ncbi:CotY/CotZ family spore coat protein [Oceanobacillus sp. FSL K6-2867]|uniref:CotY/CotZ family spore coat protein n=1 Tax=Oceanobacillus sp. FSL K6-2867 TaxID=2954748 RepID=UPI0030D74643
MSHNPHPCNHHNCVCEVVRKIVCAQKEVSDRDKNKHCSSSCENSIKQLLSSHSKSKNMNTTIPFVLFNKGSLKPFIASGVHKKEKKGCHHDYDTFAAIETPVLRAIRFIPHSCCVEVELLQPVNEHCIPVTHKGEKLVDFFESKSHHHTVDFKKTGICITLDLECFCAITCLDPIRPLPPGHHSCTC